MIETYIVGEKETRFQIAFQNMQKKQALTTRTPQNLDSNIEKSDTTDTSPSFFDFFTIRNLSSAVVSTRDEKDLQEVTLENFRMMEKSVFIFRMFTIFVFSFL